MKLNLNGTLYALSQALDHVERELVGVSDRHALRVAYLAVTMGRELALDETELMELAACAVLHDNALTEYIRSEYQAGKDPLSPEYVHSLGAHCSMGEANIRKLSLSRKTVGAVLYHHEQADGTGPFGKTAEETPLFAELIHLADQVDVYCDLSTVDEAKMDKLRRYLEANTGLLFSPRMVQLFQRTFFSGAGQPLDTGRAGERLHELLPVYYRTYAPGEIMDLADMFAGIIDYKSSFTADHSLGIARKAARLGSYYGFDQERQVKLYLAGALHDVGKLVVDTELLEKPGRLSEDEYRRIQHHAYATYQILKQIEGLEDVIRWASLHHEKLDGSGYPFGLNAKDLGREERMLACLDIYQALVEQRPYKDGMPHEDAVGIMEKMVGNGQLDGQIVQDIRLHFKVRSA